MESFQEHEEDITNQSTYVNLHILILNIGIGSIKFSTQGGQKWS